MDRQRRTPGPDHPITITPSSAHLIVKAGGRVVADTRRSMVLKEASYPAVHYIPLEDVDRSLLQRTDLTTYCPYKGDCNYFSIPAGGAKAVNAVWTYAEPYPAVAAIKDHLAFYPDRVDSVEERSDGG